MRSVFSFLAAAVLLSAVFVSPAFAQEHEHEHEHWHGDIHHFHEYDIGIWRGGHWFHGFHEGRGGWWWIAGDGWYFYPAPVYPFPDPYVPPGVVVAGPMPPPGYAGPPQYTYYCANPPGYYPYVPVCYGPWQLSPGAGVVVQPPGVLQAPPPARAPAMSAPPQTMPAPGSQVM